MTYKNAVFKGGGSKTIFSAGALQALQESHVLDNVQKVAGSSAGSLLALMTSLKMDAKEIQDFFLDFDFDAETKNHDKKAETERLFCKFGRYTGNYMLDKVKEVLNEKTGYADITFGQMQKKGLPDLYVVVTDLTNQKTLVFSPEDTPNASVAKAIKASCSYPLFFEYSDGPNREILVDGGLLDNYPIAIFDQQKYLPNKSLDYNPETLGIFPISESGTASSLYDIALLLKKFNDMDPEIMQKFLSQIDLDKVEQNDQITDIASYIKAVGDALSKFKNYTHHPEGEIFLNLDKISSVFKDINALQIDLSKEEKLAMMESGKLQTQEWIEKEIAKHNAGQMCMQSDHGLPESHEMIYGQFDPTDAFLA